MSTATPPARVSEQDATAPSYALNALVGGETHFLLRRLHSLTGIIFGGYIVVHLLVNATLLEAGRYPGQTTVFQQQVDKIHSIPFLIAVEWFAILIPLIYHTVYGLWITFTGQPNSHRYGYTKNYFYTVQRITALILVLFIAFHVLSMKGLMWDVLAFVPVGLATESTAAHLQASWIVGWVIYPIGILAATFHLSNGFWTAAVTWGLTISKAAQFRWGMVCVGLFVFTTLTGFGALLGGLRVELPEEGTAAAAVLEAAQDDPHDFVHDGTVPLGTDLLRDGMPAEIAE